MTKETFYISGMHCPGCETFIERSIRGLKGIRDANVSLASSTVVIEAESQQAMPTVEDLNRRFKKNGYSFSDQRLKQPFQPGKVLAVIGFSLVIILLFFLAEQYQWLGFLYIDSSSSFLVYVLFGVAAGFSSCAALVGSLLLSVQEQWIKNQTSQNKNGFYPFLLFNGARVISFMVLGGLLGMLGSLFQFSLAASAVLTILISILIIIIGLQMLGVPFAQKIPLTFSGEWISRVTNKPALKTNMMPITIGIITFFIPCGFTLVAQAQAIRSGNFIAGMTILLAFALGTLPVLLIISYSSIKLHQNPKFSSSFRLFSGLLIVFFAAYTIVTQIRMLDPSLLRQDQSPALSAQAPILDDDSQVQLMQMEAKGFEYFPDVIKIKAYQPTRFEIFSNGSLGCANAVYARGLYPDVIILNPGLNVVEFTAPAPGTYQISCSMWMVRPITVVVE
jgi:uncharacterized protein